VNTRLAGLGAVAVLLGGYVAVQGLGLFQPTESVQVPSSGATATRAAAVKLNPLDGLDPAAYADIVDKPLFNPSRQPRPAEPAAPPPPPEQPVVEPPPPPPPAPAGPGPDDYKLLGVSAGPDGRIAALRIASSGVVVYLRQGESVDSWSVVEIGDRTVTIGTPESPVTFSLFATGGDGAAGDGQPAPGAQQQQPLPLPLPLPMPKQQPAPQPGQPPLPEQFTLPDTGG